MWRCFATQGEFHRADGSTTAVPIRVTATVIARMRAMSTTFDSFDWPKDRSWHSTALEMPSGKSNHFFLSTP
jgi:hypothetical protein